MVPLAVRLPEALAFGNTEVRDFHRAVFIDHDVGGLDITMHNALRMREIKRSGSLAQDAEDSAQE